MSPRNILLIVIAVIFAAGTAMFVRGRSVPVEQPVQAAAPAPTTRVLVAKKDIPAGSFVKAAEDLDWAPWPENTVQPYHVKEGAEPLESYQGAVARRPVKTGEPVTAQTLIKPGAGGFLSAVLEPGKRAISVGVSPTSGTSGFIFPGDRVDVMVTHRVKIQESATATVEESVVSETFVENVRVVAVDQMLDNPENKAILAKTVTLEVTPSQAERISVAEDLGKISFSLRSLASDEQPVAESGARPEGENGGEGGPLVTTEPSQDYLTTISEGKPVAVFQRRYTRDSDISGALNRRTDNNTRIRVIRGDDTEQREFYREEGQ